MSHSIRCVGPRKAEMELLREKARRSQELQALAFQEAADQEQQKAGCLMFDPTTARRLSWDLCVILPLLAYLTVMMPFRMCFENEPTVRGTPGEEPQVRNPLVKNPR